MKAKAKYKNHGQPDVDTPEMNHQEINFKNGSSLKVNHTPTGGNIQILTPKGEVALRILMTPEGPLLHFSGAQIALQATEKITLESKQIEIKASEQLNLQSAGDLEQKVAGDWKNTITGDAFQEARIQNMEAALGNVNIKANDDVKLNGERIKMNCEENHPQKDELIRMVNQLFSGK